MTMEALLLEAAQALEQGRYPQAEALLRQVVSQWPEGPDSYHLLAVLAERLGRIEDGLSLITTSLRLAPAFAPIHETRSRLLEAAGRRPEALQALETAMSLAPGHAGLAQAYVSLLLRADQFERAYAIARDLLSKAPDSPALLRAAGTAAIFLGLLEEARRLLDQAVGLAPDSFSGWLNLALAQRFCDDLAAADAAVARAVALEPANGNARWQQGQIAFLRGDWVRGWAGHRYRYAVAGPGLGLPDGPEPVWDGRPIPGQTLRLQGDQGLGDMLAFLRLIKPMLARNGAPAGVLLDLPPSLRQLAQDSFAAEPRISVISGPGPVPAHWRLALSGLGDLLAPAPDTLPPAPFLRACPVRVARWHQRLEGMGGPRIGLVWAGNPEFRFDRLRSLPFAQASRLLATAGPRWIIMQKGPGRAGFDPAAWPNTVWDADPYCVDFADTAALIQTLDLVITCDTAVFHVAAGLGAPVWLLQSCATDWRLGANLVPPWYPGARIFRQQVPGGWDGPVDAVLEALAGVGKSPAAR